MAKKAPPSINTAKKTAILKELESVKSLLNEDKPSEETNADKELDHIEFEPSAKKAPEEHQEEFQIPLLDPGKTTTFELDFSKKEKTPPPPAPKAPDIRPEDIPTVDDITASSLFDDGDDDEDKNYQTQTSKVTEKELKDQAQLIIQDLLNEAITELEEKLDHLIPNLEERLKKRLEKSMDEYIAKALNK